MIYRWHGYGVDANWLGQTKKLFVSASSTRRLFSLRDNNNNTNRRMVFNLALLIYSCYEQSSPLKTIAHHELGLHLKRNDYTRPT